MPDFSDYIIYVDESGDHGLKSIDPEYPIFCLAFCIIKKTDYASIICPSIQELKFKYWGHEFVNLHSSDIKKQQGDFAFLRSSEKIREEFFEDLNSMIKKAPMNIVASVIQKDNLKKRYSNPYNPYEISLLFCMEKMLFFLRDQKQKGKSTKIIFESRGHKEDNELELEFRRICDNEGSWGYRSLDFKIMNFESAFVSKQENLAGLQIADLIARPIGLNSLRPDQFNRAWETIKDKMLAKKIFP